MQSSAHKELFLAVGSVELYSRTEKKRHQRESIMSVFVRSNVPPLIKTSGASAVAKNGESLLSSISLWQKFYGAGK